MPAPQPSLPAAALSSALATNPATGYRVTPTTIKRKMALSAQSAGRSNVAVDTGWRAIELGAIRGDRAEVARNPGLTPKGRTLDEEIMTGRYVALGSSMTATVLVALCASPSSPAVTSTLDEVATVLDRTRWPGRPG